MCYNVYYFVFGYLKFFVLFSWTFCNLMVNYQITFFFLSFLI